jgi:hypothetical protein
VRSRLVVVAALIAFGLCAVAMTRQFGRLPVVWPDESLLAQPAMLLLREGRLATPLLTGAANGVTDRTYWYPQGYFFLLASVFAIAGPTLEAMRATSVLAGIALIAATYPVARAGGASRSVALGAAAFLAMDPVFERAALVGRPDVVALALILLSMWLGQMRGRWELLGGFCAGCAALVQPYGVIALLILAARTIIERRRPLALAIAVIPLAAWAAYGAQDPAALADQLRLTFARHDRPWSPWQVVLTTTGQYVDPLSFIVPIGWIVAAAGLVRATRADRRAAPVLTAFVLASLTTASLQMWHPVYALPFLYIGLARTLAWLAAANPVARGWGRNWLRAGVVCITIATSAGVLALDLHQLSERARISSAVRQTAYAEWSTAIGDLLPDGSRVLLGGVPDPTWGLFGRDLQLIAMQDEPRSLAHYRDRLATEIDFVVFTGTLPDGWHDLVAPGKVTLVQRVVIDTGQHDAGCPDWEPCGPLEATVYRVVR